MTVTKVLLTGWMWLLGASLLAFQPPPGQEEFVPIDQLPPAEQLPGGAFVVVAYAFIWVAAMAYVWSLWRRLGKVEDEIRTLRRRTARDGR
jgi:CcmD family protein